MRKFYTFEGGEGSGKTTVSKLVIEKLKKNYEVLSTREPGGVESAEKIRTIILNEEIDGVLECLLFAAARRIHLVEKVHTSLNNGQLVIMDRFIDSSLVYQGLARELTDDFVFSINRLAINENIKTLEDIDIEKYSTKLSNLLTNNSSDFIETDVGRKIKTILEQYHLDSFAKILLLTSINYINSLFSKNRIITDNLKEINSLIDEILNINAKPDKYILPDATFILDIDPKIGLDRIMKNSEREINRLDKEAIDFHYAIRDGYLKIAEKYKKERVFYTINADNSPEKIADEIYSIISTLALN